MEKMRVGIIGATAYSSLELIRLLLRHPAVEVAYLGSRREERPHVAEIFPSLTGRLDLRMAGLAPEEMPNGVSVVFSTLPPTVSMHYCEPFLEAGVRVVDFSADYRFRDRALYEQWYKTEHANPARLRDAAYGIPELFRDEIRDALLVANPGCYPTAVVLALAPLMRSGLVQNRDIFVDAKSGVSGRGRNPKPETHYCECNESVAAYCTAEHRHQPEIEHVLTTVLGETVSVVFAPHLVPMDRGILATIFAKSDAAGTHEGLEECLLQAYAGEPFVRVRTSASTTHLRDFIRTGDVAHTNFCDIAVRCAGPNVILLSAIDNLIKGAAGQAVQNMNVMLGFEETAALLL